MNINTMTIDEIKQDDRFMPIDVFLIYRKKSEFSEESKMAIKIGMFKLDRFRVNYSDLFSVANGLGYDVMPKNIQTTCYGMITIGIRRESKEKYQEAPGVFGRIDVYLSKGHVVHAWLKEDEIVYLKKQNLKITDKSGESQKEELPI